MLTLIRIGPRENSEQTTFQRIVNQTMWLIGTFRNSIVIVVTTSIGFMFISATGHDVTSNEMPPIPFKVVGTYYFFLDKIRTILLYKLMLVSITELRLITVIV